MILAQLSHKLSLASSSGHPTAINPVWEGAEKPHERSYLLSGLFCFGDAGWKVDFSHPADHAKVIY
jgi:hypothetical protein